MSQEESYWRTPLCLQTVQQDIPMHRITKEYSWRRVTFFLQIVQKRCFSLIIRRKSYDTRWITLEKSPIRANCAKRHSLHKIWGYISNYTERFTLCGLIIADCATRGFSLIIQRNQNNTRGITLENSLTFENFATRYWYIMIRRVPVEINKRELMLEKS